jgi:hypothetical protein
MARACNINENKRKKRREEKRRKTQTKGKRGCFLILRSIKTKEERKEMEKCRMLT